MVSVASFYKLLHYNSSDQLPIICDYSRCSPVSHQNSFGPEEEVCESDSMLARSSVHNIAAKLELSLNGLRKLKQHLLLSNQVMQRERTLK